MSDDKSTFEIDGSRFSDLGGFYDEVSRVLIPGEFWGRNLDAFHDILRGHFGTLQPGFRLVWRNAEQSRRDLGHRETARELARTLESCHPSGRDAVARELADARAGRGKTVFDRLIEIIERHKDVELVLS